MIMQKPLNMCIISNKCPHDVAQFRAKSVRIVVLEIRRVTLLQTVRYIGCTH